MTTLRQIRACVRLPFHYLTLPGECGARPGALGNARPSLKAPAEPALMQSQASDGQRRGDELGADVP
jgi:hypothetical protein